MSIRTLEETFWALAQSKPYTRQQFFQSAKPIAFPKGSLCIRAKEKNPWIYFILSGKVCVYNLTKCGKRKILFVLGPDHIANETLMEDTGTIFCETIEACRFLAIRQEKLAELMQQDFGFTQVLFRYQERKIWRLEHQLKNTMGSIYLERKLASKLWKLGRDFGTDTSQGLRINISLSITFLADLLGAPRETTSRVCRKLAEAGLIRMEKKTIWLPDPQRIVLFYKTGVLKLIIPGN